jgi:HAMP domain-containing protein/HPt (histidine-containing phosphotransfer) domain-containing protein
MLAPKIALMQGILALLLGAGAVVGFGRLRVTEKEQLLRWDNHVRAMAAVGRLNDALHDAARATRRLADPASGGAVNPALGFGSARRRVQDHASQLRHSLPEYSRAASDFEGAFAVIVAVSQRVGQVRDERGPRDALLICNAEFEPRFQRLRQYLDQMGEQVRRQMSSEIETAVARSTRAYRQTLGGLMVAFVAGVGMAYFWAWRAVVRPLQRITAVTCRIGAGDSRVAVPCSGRRDEVGQLASALTSLQQRLARPAESSLRGMDEAARLGSGETGATSEAAGSPAEAETNAHRQPVTLPSAEPPPGVSMDGPAAVPRKRRPARAKSPPQPLQVDRLAPATARGAEDAQREPPQGVHPGVDLEEGARRMGVSREHFEDRLMQFGKAHRDTLRQLRLAVEKRKTDEARRLAQQLATDAGNVSIGELRRLARTIELAVRFGQADLNGMLRDLESEAEKVRAALEALIASREHRESGGGGAGSAPTHGV